MIHVNRILEVCQKLHSAMTPCAVDANIHDEFADVVARKRKNVNGVRGSYRQRCIDLLDEYCRSAIRVLPLCDCGSALREGVDVLIEVRAESRVP